MKKLIITSISLALLLSGCTVPGNQLVTEGKSIAVTPDNQSFDLNNIAMIYPITPLVINSIAGNRLYTSTNNTHQSVQSYKHIIINIGNTNNQPDNQANKIKDQANQPNNQKYEYHIGTGDVLNIVVWDHPELMGATLIGTSANDGQPGGFSVDTDGNIYYPFIGKVHIAGKTVNEVRTILHNRLTKYIQEPQLDVSLAKFRSQNIVVSGAVHKASQLSLTDIPMTLLNAISLAGGFTPNADLQHIHWIHNGVKQILSLQQLMQKTNLLVSAGDIIYIPSVQDQQVYVMGEVGKQGSMNIGSNGLNLTQAISNASGINQNLANATGVFVIRIHPEDEQHKLISIYQLNLQDATAYALGTRFPLENQDVVYVTATPLTRWNRVLAQILPSLSAIGVSSSATQDLRSAGLFK